MKKIIQLAWLMTVCFVFFAENATSFASECTSKATVSEEFWGRHSSSILSKYPTLCDTSCFNCIDEAFDSEWLVHNETLCDAFCQSKVNCFANPDFEVNPSCDNRRLRPVHTSMGTFFGCVSRCVASFTCVCQEK